jgi:hypothetical protein
MNFKLNTILYIITLTLILFNSACKKEEAKPKTYYVAYYNTWDGWEIKLEENSTGFLNGYITKVGLKRGDIPKAIGQKLIFNMRLETSTTYNGTVYEKTFMIPANGKMTLNPPLLTILPSNGDEYYFDLVQ